MSESDTGRDFATRVGATPVRRGGRALASFATLLALAALGLAGYPYYQRYVVGVPAPINSGEFESLRTAQQRQIDELARLTAQTTALDARLGQQPNRSDEPRSADAQGPAAEPLAAPPAMPERSLRVAEAAFLVQAANDRLLVTGDVRAALAMLLAAQSLLDQIDDAALTDVRSALSTDIASLRDVTVVDIDAAVAQLQALQKTLPGLPMRGGRFASPPVAAPTDAAPVSTASLAWQKFLSLFEFHREGGAARPPLGPDEATYLRVNLGLMLQTAQLALLRRDGVVYQQSLESVRRWLDDYLDTSAADVSAVRAEIDQLLSVRVDRSLPDVGGSLAALRKIMTTVPPAAPPATPSDAT